MVCFELEAFAEPKALKQVELETLMKSHKTIRALAQSLETPFSSIQERLRPTRRWDPKRKVFLKINSPQKRNGHHVEFTLMAVSGELNGLSSQN